MRWIALATDYDGTLAHHGVVADASIAALTRFASSGRKVLLVTGRQLDDLAARFPRLDVFDAVVAENGAVLYRPATKVTRVLAEPPPSRFAHELRARGVDPVSLGHAIVATWQPHEQRVLEVIRDLGLELQVIFNKGAVMALPSGVNKGTGLLAALRELGLSVHDVVGVGDAENDHAFVRLCEVGVAVENALPSLKEECDHVTRAPQGEGVVELVDAILRDELAGVSLRRHAMQVGQTDDGRPVTVDPHGPSILFAGASGSGKTKRAMAVVERFAERKYQTCLLDPEGDHERAMGEAVALGGADRAPSVDEVLRALATPARSTIVNLLGVALEERPAFFDALVSRLQEIRARLGRPHWIVLDEAHHLLPSAGHTTHATPRDGLDRMVFITVHPAQLPRAVISGVGVLFAVGEQADETVREFARATGRALPVCPSTTGGQALMWRPALDPSPVRVSLALPRADHLRHRRKYAKGNLGADKSFYFRGPEGRLKLRAQNLQLFVQIAEGLDEETWLFHLRNGDYARWFRDDIKDQSLADTATSVAQRTDLGADESRSLISAAISERYTAQA